MNKNSNNSIPDENTQVERCEQMPKKTNNNSMMRYKWIQQIRRIIMTDLKRHFGREIFHDRLFSCLGKTAIDYNCLFCNNFFQSNHLESWSVFYLNFYSIAAYDFAFCQFIVTIVFVAVWNGTWQNLDSLFDRIIFNGNLVYSSVASLTIGAFASSLIIFFQLQIRTFSEDGGL